MWRQSKALILLVILALLGWRLGGFDSQRIAGIARTVDGDTLTVAGERVRLEGLDAPERDQFCGSRAGDWPCGQHAMEALDRLAAGRRIACNVTGRDRYGRHIGRCTVGETDINAALVEAGWAVADLVYSRQERAARRSGRGIWRGPFDHPREWRARNEVDVGELRR